MPALVVLVRLYLLLLRRERRDRAHLVLCRRTRQEDRARVLDEPPVVMDALPCHAHALEACVLIDQNVLLKWRWHASNQEIGAHAATPLARAPRSRTTPIITGRTAGYGRTRRPTRR